MDLLLNRAQEYFCFISVLLSKHEFCVFVYVVVKHNVIAVSKFEQPSCLMACVYLGKKNPMY